MSTRRKNPAVMLLSYLLRTYYGQLSPIGRREIFSRPMRSNVKRGRMVRLCPGRRHAWFESNVGLIRKPL